MTYLKSKFTSFNAFLDKYIIQVLIFSIISVSVVVVLWPYVVKSIPTGYLGVLYQPLWGGTNLNKVYEPGLHFVLPWDTMENYDGRIQTEALNLDVLTSDLLQTNINVSYQFTVNKATLPLLHKFVGSDYIKKVLQPFVTSAIRGQIAQLDSSKAFTADFSEVLNSVAISADDRILADVSPPGYSFVKLVSISSVQISGVTFSPEMQASIQQKMAAKQLSESYEFKIAAAKQEASRKEIEATGISKFQDIVRPGLTDNYLRWRGIEATQSLAESNNSKIIMFGQGNTGLPLILGDMDKNPTVAPKPKQ